jgi:hypothetical protein
MGYYTNFELSIHEGTADLMKVREALLVEMGLEIDDSHPDWYFYVDGDVLRSGDSMKWYDHDIECAEVSKRFPGVVIALHGEGENPGDIWDAYYKDGQMQICRASMVCPPYDPAKLKSVEQAQKEDSGRP